VSMEAQAQPGFLGAIPEAKSYADQGAVLAFLGGTPVGNAPTPFGALDGPALAGPSGSHPLARIRAQQLLEPHTDDLEGTITVDGPVRVGEGISGRISVRALKRISANTANLRLVGVQIAEERRSKTERDSNGTTRTEDWIEVHGSVIETSPFTEPFLPATLEPGQTVEATFNVPAPRLGPPSAHAGTVLIAWALEARWDVGMGFDQRVATLLDIRQHPDLLRAGVIDVGAGAMADTWTDEGATFGVDPVPPIPIGGTASLTIGWPSAADGRSGRVELDVLVNAPIDITVTAVSLPVELGALRGGTTVSLPIPMDAPPTFAHEGVSVSYRVRAIVDRRLRSDVTAERLIVVC
jgi:hypothetical protein